MDVESLSSQKGPKMRLNAARTIQTGKRFSDFQKLEDVLPVSDM
jgi:hypothetical protein